VIGLSSRRKRPKGLVVSDLFRGLRASIMLGSALVSVVVVDGLGPAAVASRRGNPIIALCAHTSWWSGVGACPEDEVSHLLTLRPPRAEGAPILAAACC